MDQHMRVHQAVHAGYVARFVAAHPTSSIKQPLAAAAPTSQAKRQAVGLRRSNVHHQPEKSGSARVVQVDVHDGRPDGGEYTTFIVLGVGPTTTVLGRRKEGGGLVDLRLLPTSRLSRDTHAALRDADAANSQCKPFENALTTSAFKPAALRRLGAGSSAARLDSCLHIVGGEEDEDRELVGWSCTAPMQDVLTGHLTWTKEKNAAQRRTRWALRSDSVRTLPPDPDMGAAIGTTLQLDFRGKATVVDFAAVHAVMHDSATKLPLCPTIAQYDSTNKMLDALQRWVGADDVSVPIAGKEATAVTRAKASDEAAGRAFTLAALGVTSATATIAATRRASAEARPLMLLCPGQTTNTGTQRCRWDTAKVCRCNLVDRTGAELNFVDRTGAELEPGPLGLKKHHLYPAKSVHKAAAGV